MRKRYVSLFSLLLALALLGGVFPGGAQAAEPERRSGSMEYYSTVTGDYVSDRYEYTDQWLLGDPAARNDSLALVSAQLAAASADDRHGVAFLKDLGFTDAEGKRYDSEDPADCAYTIGMKTLRTGGGDRTLVAVAFQGACYGDKGWQQNVTVNDEGDPAEDHAAYAVAAKIFLEDLDELALKGPVILWLTGQSRGAAVADLAAAYLLDREDPPVVFAITFASPATTEDPEAGGDRYGGIQNYLCPDDPLSMLPPWGMSRYGQTVTYSDASMEAVAEELESRSPEAGAFARSYDAAAFGGDVQAYLEGLAEKLTEAVPQRGAYSQRNRDSFPDNGTETVIEYDYQSGLRALCHLAFSGNGDLLDALSPLLDDETALPTLTYSYLEEAYADAKDPPERAGLLSDAAQKRWAVAGMFCGTVSETAGELPFRQEDIYALLKLMSPLMVDAGSVTGEDGTLPAFDASFLRVYTDYFDFSGVLNFALNTDTLFFPHQTDVILARMKLLVSPPAARAYADVPEDAYYAPAVVWAVAEDITRGTSDAHFSPDASCTRAQTVTFLWRAAGAPEPSGTENPFTDVVRDDYYYNAVLWAVEQGITEGTDGTRFSPEETVTRCQSVTFLYRLLGEEIDAPNPFADVKEGAFCYDAVRWAAEEGVTTGKTAERFAPADDCTRAQIVTFLYRALEQA